MSCSDQCEGVHHRKRPSWDSYFIEMAKLVATRATCPRRRIGAVLVRDHRILATGYNGSVRGAPHCDDVGCLLITNGNRQSCIRTVHAEMNALLQCALNGVSTLGSTLYSTDFPCIMCAKALVQAGIKRIVFLKDYPDKNSADLLKEAGIEMFRGVEQADGECILIEGDPFEEK